MEKEYQNSSKTKACSYSLDLNLICNPITVTPLKAVGRAFIRESGLGAIAEWGAGIAGMFSTSESEPEPRCTRV